MKCLDCDKVFSYPVVERGRDTAMCPVCFGSNLMDVTLTELEFARAQRWHFDKPPETPESGELQVTMVVVPDHLWTGGLHGGWWLGYVLTEGGTFQLRYIGTEAEIDRMLTEYKLSGGKMMLPLNGMPGMCEEVQVFFAIKLHASEALRIVPRASEVIDARGGAADEETTADRQGSHVHADGHRTH